MPFALAAIVALAALAGCQKIRPEKTWDSARLISALDHPSVEVRERAAKHLGVRRAKQAVWPLIAALGDEQWTVRHKAARSLGQIRDERAVIPLVKLLHDKH